VTVNEQNPSQSGDQSLAPSSGLAGRGPHSDSHLDLLLDVQLEATIRFGERQLLLRDILSMGPGSVIELDRRLDEPADLLVAGRLIARGEVVVVNGSFGLRITELANAAPEPESAQAG
jgi:flagellar motor switch protein FliN/FliY